MICCTYETDAPQVYRESWPVSRKTYSCCECGIGIKPGETYQRVVLLQDGYWGTYHTCEKCADLRDSLAEVGCPYLGGLMEAFQDWLTNSPHARSDVKPGTHAARLVPSYFLEEDDGGDMQAVKVGPPR